MMMEFIVIAVALIAIYFFAVFPFCAAVAARDDHKNHLCK